MKNESIAKSIKKSKPWYSRSLWAVFALIILATIDVAGFTHGLLSTNMVDFDRSSFMDISLYVFAVLIMISGFAVAFEISTIYIAYAFSLKLYHYDKCAIRLSKRLDNRAKLSNFISTTSLGWISFAAFALGVGANIILRLGIMGDKPFFSETTGRITFDGSFTIVMIVLPIITSILNFVIACFVFDPILYELNGLEKNIRKIAVDIDSLEREKIKISREIAKMDQLKNSQERQYKSQVARVLGMKIALRTRIYEEIMKSA